MSDSRGTWISPKAELKESLKDWLKKGGEKDGEGCKIMFMQRILPIGMITKLFGISLMAWIIS